MCAFLSFSWGVGGSKILPLIALRLIDLCTLVPALIQSWSWNLNHPNISISILQECGPRFTLKLISLQHGTFDTKGGEYEWVHKVIFLFTSLHSLFGGKITFAYVLFLVFSMSA